MSSSKVAIHYCSALNAWIEFFVIVDGDDADEAAAAVKRAVDSYWESDDQCYWDEAERELKETGLDYQLILCEYDPENDEPTNEWVARKTGIYQKMPVIEV